MSILKITSKNPGKNHSILNQYSENVKYVSELLFKPASFSFAPGTPLYKDISEKNLIK
jgi:hypothetical protein